MSDEPNEAAMPCQNCGGETPGGMNFCDNKCRQIASLRSALANAEKSLTAARDDLLREGMERDQALAKLAEAEKEAMEVVGDYRELSMELDAVTTERNSLAAQLAEARGLLGDLRKWIGHGDHCLAECSDDDPCSCGASSRLDRIDAFLAPPSDRGAEEIGHE